MLDIDHIKQSFPILKQPLPNGKSLVYLDNAATTQKPEMVLAALSAFYKKHNANVHRGVHYLATQATAAYEQARATAQGFLNAASREEVIFTSGTTEGINLVASSLAQSMLKPDDEVLITAMEHHSNLIPWQQACLQTGAKLKVIPIHKSGELQLDALDQLLTPRTCLLAVTHISNTLGTINPIKLLIEKAHKVGAMVLIDAAQSAAYYPLDVQALDCDFLVFSGHKVFGPTGIGVLYGKKVLLEALPPYQFGGEMIRSVSFEKTTFAALPHRLEAGTPNIAGAVGLAAALRFIEQLDREAIQAYLKELLEYGTEQLRQIEDLTIIGNAAQKSAIISFTLETAHPHDIATILNEYGVAIRAGHHCTEPLMDFYEVPATARASFSIYNTKKDVDQLVEGIAGVVDLIS